MHSEPALTGIRRLPPLVVRLMVLADLGLGLFPPYAWWLLRRWTGRTFTLGELLVAWPKGVVFCVQHMIHALRGESGLGVVRWNQRPVRQAPMSEREDHLPAGSCGSCYNCCQTYWMPDKLRLTCPLRDDSGCQAYGGLWWDYFNCGSYPVEPEQLATYDCPRFDGAVVATKDLSLSQR